MRYSWSRCFVPLSDAWDWGNGFSSVNGVICFGSSLFNPGVVVDWFDSSCLCLTRWLCVVTLWFVLVVWWCDCDSLVNRMKWLWWRGGVGWIVRRGSGLTGKMVVYLMWFMEFWLTGCRWLCRRAAGRGWVVLLVLLGGQVKVDSQHWLKFVMVGRFVECETLLSGWLVGWVMNDE